MFAFPSLPSPSLLPVRALNALLQRESWARERLMPHAGKVVCFIVGPVRLSLLIQADGMLTSADAQQPADVTLSLPVQRLADGMGMLGRASPADLANLMQVQGDAGLANAVSVLAAQLRPDPEHELAGLVGDAAAVRVLSLGKAAIGSARQAGGRLAANVAEYVSEEAGLMASRPALLDLAQRIAQLDSRLDALDARMGNAGRPVVHRSLRGA